MSNAANKDGLCLSVDALNTLNNKNETKSDEESVKPQKKFDFSAKERSLKGLVQLKQSFRTLSVPKRTTEKDKNEPSRFLGDGVTFKAKLIGILEVEEARGDRMCQEALFELKMAVRAAGEHKQRINIVIAIDGIRLRDEKTGDCLYHHPVHKISFIAQDVADSRAFGYIFGSPDTGHRFFGIKTDKAANQVVMAMRDLFQAVYELKKREVEMAKQNIEQHQLKYGSSFFLDSISSTSFKASNDGVLRTTKLVTRDDSAKIIKNKTQTAGVIADLMDLELELNSLQQGLSQMERLTPSDPFGPSPSVPKEDPFGDSFTPPPCITTPPPAKLPPPPASGDRRKVGSTSSGASQSEMHWFDRETQELFSNDKNVNVNASENTSVKEKREESRIFERSDLTAKDLYDVFTDLDPLGSGRSKPYMDKKDFFQELKNPPKKLLKDLVGNESADGNNFSTCFTGNSKSMFSEEPEKIYEEHFRKYNSLDSGGTPRGDLHKTDSFYDHSADPFETSFANFATFDGGSSATSEEAAKTHRRSPQIHRKSPSAHTTTVDASYHNIIKSSTSKPSYRPMMSESDSFAQKSRPQWNTLPAEENAKQKIVINLRKVLSNADDTDKENDSPVAEEATVLKNMDINSPAQGDISSDSFESIPEPPPRPITSPVVSQPPPLPPKKLQLPVTMKPPPRPSSDTLSHYDYIENYESLGSRRKLNGDMHIPPLPAPARKPKFSHDTDREFARHRPHKQQSSASESEYYLTPISKTRSEKEENHGKVKPSLNITLSQLTSTGFDDLAKMLRIPASALSKMTLKELTECLSQLSDAECQKLESDMCNKNRSSAQTETNNYRSEKRRNKHLQGTAFKANFEEKFPPPTPPPSTTATSHATQVDKYAVFRELIEQEEKNQAVEKSSSEDRPDPPTESEPSNSVVEEKKSSAEKDDDKYAALRTITLEKHEDNVKESSEKEDSATEVMIPAEDSEPTGDVILTEKLKEPETPVAEKDEEPVEVDGCQSTVDEDRPKPAHVEETDEKEENKASSESELGKNWAKFDSEQDTKVVNTPSPWQDEGKEESKVEETKPIRYKKHRVSRKRWNDDEDEDDDDGNDEDYGDDSEENWESSKKSLGSSWDESSWRENGWSDRDSLYDDAEASPTASYRERRYQLKKKGYHRKFSPHKKSADHSPWEEEPEWQSRKPMYKEYVKGDDRRYDERKVRTPPWTGERNRYGQKEEDELMLLKMMLGKKRLKALEDQLFKHYQDQLSDPAKKAYYSYVKSKELPCNNDYSDVSSKSRYAKKYYTQRPKSADKGGRKPLTLRAEDTEELFSAKKYRRPCSHDELSISEEEKWPHMSPTYKKPGRSRNQSQTSPFEDNFSPQSYEYPEPQEPIYAKNKNAHRYATPSRKAAESKRPLELHPYSAYDFKSGRSSRESSQRQSPFEDDFTPPDTQKCNERGSDVSKDSSDRRNDDEVFFSSSTADGRSSKSNARASRISRYEHAKRVERPNKHYENVEIRKKTPDPLFYEKASKEKYGNKYSSKESNGETGSELKSPKKAKHPPGTEARRHDPFNDNVVHGYESKTVPRLQRTKSKSKVQNYDSGSDSAEAGVKWKDDLSSFTFAEQHSRK